jgi:hypothetical protein
MPENSFMTVKSWLRTAAEIYGIPMSNRQAHRATNGFISTLTKEQYDNMHADPTGETAVRNVMAWMAAKQVAA